MPSVGHSIPLQHVWQRVAARIGVSAERGRQVTTVLRRDMRIRRLPGGGVVLAVYSSAPAAARPKGQAHRLRLVSLPPGASCRLPMLQGLGWQCLVLAGHVTVDAERLGPLDHHQRPAGLTRVSLISAGGAQLLMRESHDASASEPTATQREALSAWQHLPAGISRRLLGGAGAQRTSLLRLAPGCALPAHRTSTAQECLLLEGELYVDDRLLRAGDYQAAPAGAEHGVGITDTGTLLYRHGDDAPDAPDAALDFKP